MKCPNCNHSINEHCTGGCTFEIEVNPDDFPLVLCACKLSAHDIATAAVEQARREITRELEPPINPRCEVDGCKNDADFEGWYRVFDFAGQKTGLIQRRQVCEQHRHFLIGGQKETEPK